MTNSRTPVTVTEMPIIAGAHPDRLVARFANWDDAVAIAERWSKTAESSFYQVRFNDGYTIATENYLRGIGGDYVETPTTRARKMRIGLGG